MVTGQASDEMKFMPRKLHEVSTIHLFKVMSQITNETGGSSFRVNWQIEFPNWNGSLDYGYS
jgi:hypothetical protein